MSSLGGRVGFVMPQKIYIPDALQALAGKVKRGGCPPLTVRDLIAMFGAQKRRFNLVGKVKKALKKLDLATSPDFSTVSLSEPVRLIKRVKKQQAVLDELRDPMLCFGMLECVEQQRKIRRLRAIDEAPDVRSTPAAIPEWSIGPQETVERAIILLSKPGVDFVPVFNDPKNVLGVLSWDDFGIKSLLDKNSRYIKCRELMKAPVVVSESDSVYDRKDEIVASGYVIVKNQDGIAYAVVRAADLAAELLRLTESFLLLQEIESVIRNILDILNLNQIEFDGCLPPDRRNRHLSSADLEFSQYISFLSSDVVVRKLSKYKISGHLVESIRNHLGGIREIRNGVVHFHPDENSDSDKKELKGTRDFLLKIYAELPVDEA